MQEKVHLGAARLYFRIGEETHQKYELEKDQDQRIALRVVAAQNYFYAIVNWIEAVLAKFEEHSFNHENRVSRMHEHYKLFQDILGSYGEIERNQRNKVTYRGENGPKYENMKQLARLLKEKYG